MALLTLPVLVLWTLTLLFALSSALALPMDSADSSSLTKHCTNFLTNPSFEAGELPWLAMVTGSWETRGIWASSSGGHSGSNYYYGLSNSTIETSITLSQSGLSISPGQVNCSAWVASSRPGNMGSTRIEVYLDDVSCAPAVQVGTTGWMKVGGTVGVQDVEGGHTLAVVIVGDVATDEGWSISLDDLSVGSGC
ncbi:hypothetical protein EJ02DRAFT_218238 [Clathrospora elynae]|uniref:Uncharacterized protein n=1 Tax=Clathrospora elynae TaxID=706981 RepID=A0A6A5T7K6_9PLEO|nr:hypothetical protein EJ02DRAFT_218238 [Clathrospora elynae]